jgi:hypothetical protein
MMRTITIFCVGLLLASYMSSQQTGKKKTTPKKTQDGGVGMTSLPPDNDSSPIIISDGSIDLKHYKPNRYFSNKQPKDADVAFPSYSPSSIGFLCDPPNTATGLSACTKTCQSGNNTAACQVGLGGAGSWDLLLCEDDATCKGNGTVTIKWDGATPEKMKVHSNKNAFTYVPSTGSNPTEMLHKDTPLSKAVLKLKSGATYTLTCTTGARCLVIGYDCATGCLP